MRNRWLQLTLALRYITHSGKKRRKIAKVGDLAVYLGIPQSEVSLRFFSATNRRPLRAAITLKALRWACLMHKSDFEVPDWETLKYLTRRHWEIKHGDSSRVLTKLQKQFRVPQRTLRSYLLHPWRKDPITKIMDEDHHCREPSGDFALRLLAHYLSPAGQELFTDHILYHLEKEYPYDDVPEIERQAFRKNHAWLVGRTNKLVDRYGYPLCLREPWLQKILQ